MGAKDISPEERRLSPNWLILGIVIGIVIGGLFR